jgi:hypothetical protein
MFFLPSSICSSIGAAAFSASVPRISGNRVELGARYYRLRSRSRPSPAHRYPLFFVHSSTSAQTPLLEQVRWSDAHVGVALSADGSPNKAARCGPARSPVDANESGRVSSCAQQAGRRIWFRRGAPDISCSRPLRTTLPGVEPAEPQTARYGSRIPIQRGQQLRFIRIFLWNSQAALVVTPPVVHLDRSLARYRQRAFRPAFQSVLTEQIKAIKINLANFHTTGLSALPFPS